MYRYGPAKFPCGSDNQSNPSASGDVLDDEVLEQSRLAYAGLADDIHLLARITTAKAKGQGVLPGNFKLPVWLSFYGVSDQCGRNCQQHLCFKLVVAGG